MNIKDERMKEVLRELAAEYLNRASTRAALLTVTNIELSDDLKSVRILLSVLPKEKEYGAVDFANRHRTEFTEFIKKKSRLRFLPRVTFAPDIGEQNRQRITELLETK
jgi:ribosome-binding factor A